VPNNPGTSLVWARPIAWSVIVLTALSLTAGACKKSGGGGFGDTPLNPSQPPAGLDTSQKQMRDGAGTLGPVRARLQSIKPDLGSQVLPSPPTFDPNSKCSQSSPFSCFAFLAEVCMDAVSNPDNISFLNGMRVEAVFSADGINALNYQGMPMEVQPRHPGMEITVGSGGCTTMQTPDNEKPGYPAEGTPRYFMLTATYGPAFLALHVDSAACPTPETITANHSGIPPACAFRAVYDLGYHF